MPSFLLPLLSETAPQSNGLTHMLIMFGGVFFIMYLLVIRPQKKQERDRLAMLSAITKNDHVLTSGGIIGVVMNVKDHEVVLKIDDDKNIRVRVARSAITNVLDKDGLDAAQPAKR